MDMKALIQEAQNPKTTPERLAELAAHAEVDVRTAVARHRVLEPALLAKLLDDPAWEVRLFAAHNEKAPRERAVAIVEEMAASDKLAQRRPAAKSKLLSVETLTKLAADSDAEVRSNAARNPRTPAEVARGLLTDGEPAVVLGAVLHPSVSREERRGFVTEDLLLRFFDAHADGDHLFELLCMRYLWDVLERAFPDPERFEDVWQEIVREHFELIEIPSRNTLLTAVSRDHWPKVAARLAEEIRGGDRSPA